MAKFLKDNDLNSELEKIVENAQETIILVSPYIKLHDRFKSILLDKDDPEIDLVILFGKNENDITQSMGIEEFEFFKRFPNIEILYERNLHAKYYANERNAILTSMNLIEYSQNNNYEAGILLENSLRGAITGDNTLDKNTWDYFDRILSQAEVLYVKKPIYEKNGILGVRKYVKSEVKIDILEDIFPTIKNTQSKSKKINPTKIKKGFCIRTGEQIPFNMDRPFSYNAFQSWSKYKNEEFPEKFCHFSGENSEGKTSSKKPVLKKNWKKIKNLKLES